MCSIVVLANQTCVVNALLQYNISMADHATIIRATPVLIVDLQMNRVGIHCLECRPNNKRTSSCALILYCYCKEQLSVLTCMNVQSCMKSQAVYDIL